MIKVKEAKMRSTAWEAHKPIEVFAVEGKLVFVDLPFEEAQGNILCQCIKEMQDVKVGAVTFQHKLFTSLDYWRPIKPIWISETEKIEVNDWAYCKAADAVGKVTRIDGNSVTLYEKNKYAGSVQLKDCYKVLALPDHFTTQHLDLIVKGTLKEGDIYLIECEINSMECHDDTCDGFSCKPNQIKLNSSNHISLYKSNKTSGCSNSCKLAVNQFGKIYECHINGCIANRIETNTLYKPKDNKLHTGEEVKAIIEKLISDASIKGIGYGPEDRLIYQNVYNDGDGHEDIDGPYLGHDFPAWFEQNVK